MTHYLQYPDLDQEIDIRDVYLDAQTVRELLTYGRLLGRCL